MIGDQWAINYSKSYQGWARSCRGGAAQAQSVPAILKACMCVCPVWVRGGGGGAANSPEMQLEKLLGPYLCGQSLVLIRPLGYHLHRLVSFQDGHFQRSLQ